MAWATLLRRAYDAPDGGRRLAHATRIAFHGLTVLNGILVWYSDGTLCTLGKRLRHIGPRHGGEGMGCGQSW